MIIDKNTVFRAFPLAIALALTACGGGGGGGSSDSGGGTGGDGGSGDEVVLNRGGDPSNPTPVSLALANEINADTFQNHFKITVEAGDTLIIK